MRKILILADDLTGAADCGVAFAGRGVEATVVLSGPGGDLPAWNGKGRAEVLAIDADTRCLPQERAAEVVARMVHGFGGPDGEPGLLFKKVDSTLRGNVGVELAAALHARRAGALSSGRVTMLFAPAFPAQGRTTVNGIQMVNGRPLEEAVLGRGEGAVPGGDLDGMGEEAGLSCGLIEMAKIRGGADALEAAMRRIAKEKDAVVCDAETENDLRAIAEAGRKLGPETVWAGSAGLARHLAQAIGFEREEVPAGRKAGEVQGHGPSLFVIGSTASASREQARVLAASGVACFTFAGQAELAGERSPGALAGVVLERLAGGEDVLVQLESPDGWTVAQGREFAGALARAIRPYTPRLGALVATGGETARAVLDAWGIGRMTLIGEVEAGVAYSVAECGDRSLRILTKAGGFGTPNTLLRCREFLRRPVWAVEQEELG